jgi:two-component system OmpR family sensor kinase
MRLRTKMVFIAVGLTLLGLALGLLATYWALLRFRLADIDEDSKLLSQIIAEATLAEPRYVLPASVNEYLVRSSGVSAAQVYRNDRLLWQGDVLEAPEPLDTRGLLGMNGARTVGIWRVYTYSREDITVQIGRRLNALQLTLQPFTIIAVPLSLLLSILSGVLAWFVSGIALRPLERLTYAARTFTEETSVPTIVGSDEAAMLADSFRDLLARLKAQRKKERDFLAYAAHELRTPISALRSSLEAARIQGIPLEIERLWQLHREALRLETFTQNLLAVARSESGELRLQAVDMADLIASAFDRFQTLALETGHELVLDIEPAPIRADPRLLEQALNNLVANALRHTPEGQITLRSRSAADGSYIEVLDEGSGVAATVSEGLGLRVIRSVAQAHKAVLMFGPGQVRLRFFPAHDSLKEKLVS